MRARSLGWWQVEPGQNIDAECPSLTNQINKSNKTYHNKILCHHLIAIESIPWIVHLQCNKTGPVQVQVQVQSRSRSSPLQFPVKSTQHTASLFILFWFEQAQSKHYFWLRFMRDREEMVDHSMAVMWYMTKNERHHDLVTWDTRIRQ